MSQSTTDPCERVTVVHEQGILFADASGRKLRLDLSVPIRDVRPPVVVMIHGGGWRCGSRDDPANDKLAEWIVSQGFAIARIDYRRSSEAIFPAQIFDCKGAVRWLRSHEDQYGYDGQRIAALGESSGGHLAVLLGTTAGNKALEGDVGGDTEQPSHVQAIIDLFGPTDFIQRAKDQPLETSQPAGKVHQLLGGPVHENLELARLASGLYHVSKDAPPLLILHGSEDQTVLLNQSEGLLNAYVNLGLKATLHLVEGAAHGGQRFYGPRELRWIADFLHTSLQPKV